MTERSERVAGEVRAILGEAIARGEIKDPRVRDAGIVTITHVRISGDLRQARARFTVHGADEAALERVREGLDHAAGFLARGIGRNLRMKVTPRLTFEIDRVFDEALKVERLLREVATPIAAPAEAPVTPDDHHDEDDGDR